MQFRHFLSCVLLLSVVLATTGTADTFVGGALTSDTTWSVGGNPHVLTQTVTVADQACLTIEPGVSVRFHPDCALSVDNGTLVARGTAASNILFTAHLAPPEDNRWDCIHLGSNATDAAFDADGNYTNGCIIEHAVVQFAEDTGAIHADGSSPYVHQSVLVSNECVGVYGNGSTGMRLHGNTFCYNAGGGLRLTSSHVVVISSNQVSHNSEGGLFFDACDLVSLSCNSICSNSWWGVLIHGSSSGTMCALVSSNDLSHNGIAGIYLSMGDNAIIRNNTVFSNGVYEPFPGYRGVGGGILFEAFTNAALSANDVRGNAGAGIQCYRSRKLVLSADPGAPGTICGNFPYEVAALAAEFSTTHDELCDPWAKGNVDARDVDWGTTNIAEIQDGIYDFFDDPDRGVVFYDGIHHGFISNNVTWSVSNGPYVVSPHNILVAEGAALTIEPGTEVRFGPRLGLYVATGQLAALGTQDSNVVFTANGFPPDAQSNRWGCIRFSAEATSASFDGDGNYTNGCIIENAIVEYAGGGRLEGALRVEESTPFIHSSLVRYNARGGIYLTNASGIHISDNDIAHNSASNGAGIHLRASDNVLLTANRVWHNTATNGGGLYFDMSAGVTLTDTSIRSNSADAGSGVYLCNDSDENVLHSDPSNAIEIAHNVGPNQLYNGNDYTFDLSLGAQGNVDARNVWWGTTNAAAIRATIYDFFDDGSKGVVIWDTAEPVPDGVITNDVTWTPQQSPYVVSQSVAIVDGATLTIQDGVTVRFAPHSAITVNDGQLVARGKKNKEIIFTADAVPPDAESNGWGYIGFGDGATDATFHEDGTYSNGCILELAVIEYAGGTARQGAIHVQDSSPFIFDCVIKSNRNGGIYAAGAFGMRILDSSIIENVTGGNGGGICFKGGSGAILTSNSICCNQAEKGGGICFDGSDNSTLACNSICSNSADAGSGVYLCNDADGTVFSADAAHVTEILDNSGSHQVDNDNPVPMTPPMWTGDPQPDAPGNVDARDVWWGSASEADIRNWIHDGWDRSPFANYGFVVYDPFVVRHRVLVSVFGNGSVTKDPDNPYYEPLDNVTLTAIPSNTWYFSYWTNHLSGTDPSTNVVMTTNLIAGAVFAPYVASNNTPIWWLLDHGLGTNDTDTVDDPDGDTWLTWREYCADTDPTNELSYLALTNITLAPSGIKIAWQGGVLATQLLERTDSLVNTNWTTVFTNLPPAQAGVSHVDAAGTNRMGFYRIRAGR